MLANIRILFRILSFFCMAFVYYGSKVAWLLVDLQNDFVDKERGTLSKAANGLVIWAINLTTWIAEKLGWLIIFSKDWHPDDTSHFKQWPKHCVAGTWGAMIHPRIYVPENAIFVYKGTKDGEDGYSAEDARTDEGHGIACFDLIKAHRINVVVTAGAYLDFCVKATDISLIKNFFVTYLLSFATCPVNFYSPEDGDKTTAELKAIGAKVV